MNLDLSKFKKTEASDKHTILQHEKGHTLKIAHNGLSAEFRKQLEEMPSNMAKGGISRPSKAAKSVPTTDYTEPKDMGTDQPTEALGGGAYPPCINPSCKSYGRSHPNCKCYGMADGGKVDNFCSQDRAHKKDCEYYAEGSKEGVGGPMYLSSQDVNPNVEPQVNSEAVAPQEPSEPSIPETSEAQTDEDQTPTSAPVDAFPQAGTTQSYKGPDPSQMNPVQIANSTTEFLKNERDDVQKDFANGHIKPETYKDLFENKSLPGKIGTILGLITAGAGSGLTHQPNMLMQMMDNEISRDLKAQEDSKSNQLSFMKVANETLKNQAEVSGININNEITRTAYGWSLAARSALHDQVQQAMNDPNPVTRNQRLQVLSNMYNMVDQKESDIFSKAGLATAIQSGGMNAGAGVPTQAPIDYNKMNQLQRQNQLKLPGAPSDADIGNMTTESKHLEQTEALRRDFNNAFNQLDKMYGAGKLSPNARESVINTLAAKAAPVVGVGHANGLIESMMPQASDWGKTRDIKRQSNNQYFDVLSAGTPTLERFGVLKPKEQYKTVKGVKYKRGPHGEAIKVE